MRQAGRYLPEYLAVRAKHPFLEVCETPELALEVTLQPLRRFELDAAIVFSDILPVLTAIGRSWDLVKGKGPVIHQPFRDPAEVRQLVRPDVAEALPHVPATIRLFREAKPDTPILGFAGAPFTLLCYLVEGGSSKDWVRTKRLLWEEPEAADAVLSLLADVIGDYLQSQIDAGAAAVQLFDTWAGALSPAMWERWAGRYAARALARVSGAPRLYFTRDTSPFLSRLHQTGADAIGLDCDWFRGSEFGAAAAEVPEIAKDFRDLEVHDLKELDAVLAYLDKLKPQCEVKVPSYEERKAAREQEIEGLKNALDILADDLWRVGIAALER